jgi:TonB-dependent SusC/RagA subfamily outer membrane receptor
MKKTIFLIALTALLAGCGASNRAFQDDDQVEVGYGTRSKREMTTAVSNLKVKKTESQTYSDMYDYLRGRVAGVTVTSDKRILIRGIGTNSDSTDPLILVDGVQVTDLSTLNPADVQSVDVIKDGSSAIYGMQGANGVIIIKTRGYED